MALTDHGHGYYYPAAWRRYLRAAMFYDDPPYFVAIPGYEYTLFDWKKWGKEKYIEPGGSHHNVYFAEFSDAASFVSERGELYAAVVPESSTIDKVWRLLREKGISEAMTVPHQLNDAFNMTDWSIRDPEYRTVMEIFQTRGSYEHEGCPRQSIVPTNPHFKGIEASWAQCALERGHRLGFIASGDHSSTGIGTAALLVKEVSRQGIIEALKSRRCYGTTGDKIFLDFRVDGHIMGREIRSNGKPRISAAIEGTDAIENVVVFKNNRVMYEKNGDELAAERELGPSVVPRRLELDMVDEDFAEDSFYYLRVIQKNDEIAWSSPIWVDRA
jgi:hypothetical protein